jgi:drug/metabolite transporter (DMT)-like permease
MKISRATLIGLIAPLLWATSLPLIKLCSGQIGAFYLPAIQYLMSGTFGLVYFCATARRPFEVYNRPKFLPRLVLFTAYFALLYPAIYLVQKPNFPGVLLLNYLWPTFTLLFTLVLLRLPFGPLKLLLGTILVVIGLALEILPSKVFGITASGGSVEPFPFAMSFSAAICWGLYSALNRKWGDIAGGVQAVPLLMLCAGIALLVLATFVDQAPTFPPKIIVPLIYLCATPFLANVAWDIGTRHGNLPLLSLVCDFIPWISLTLTAIYLDIQLEATTLVSAFLIVVGALVSRLALLPTRLSSKIDP